MSVSIKVDEQDSKRIAKALQARFADLGIEIKLGQAYEALAAVAGLRDWNTMKAQLEVAPSKAAPPSGVTLPPLADALWAAATQGERDGTIGKNEAAVLVKASQGDKEALKQLSASCGHVSVVTIDVDAEVERWHGAFEEFLVKNTGQRKPFSREVMTEAAVEFAEGTEYSRSAIADFFHDWLYERVTESGRTISGPAKP